MNTFYPDNVEYIGIGLLVTTAGGIQMTCV